jgi:hypothetical protein
MAPKQGKVSHVTTLCESKNDIRQCTATRQFNNYSVMTAVAVRY